MCTEGKTYVHNNLVIAAKATYLCSGRYYRYSFVVYLHCGVSGNFCQHYQPLYR
jgi:hypothetical protein